MYPSCLPLPARIPGRAQAAARPSRPARPGGPYRVQVMARRRDFRYEDRDSVLAQGALIQVQQGFGKYMAQIFKSFKSRLEQK
jgi:hypothetical protein